MPSAISTVNPIFKLSNSRYTDTNINWQSPNTSRFNKGEKVVILTHGWTEEWDDRSWINDGRDAFRGKNVNFIGIDWSGGSQDRESADYQMLFGDRSRMVRESLIRILIMFNRQLILRLLDVLLLICSMN